MGFLDLFNQQSTAPIVPSVLPDIKYSTIKGVLYITTKRIIFVGGADGFDRKTEDLVAVTPYANCIELQFSKDILKLFMPGGNLPHIVLRLI